MASERRGIVRFGVEVVRFWDDTKVDEDSRDRLRTDASEDKQRNSPQQNARQLCDAD